MNYKLSDARIRSTCRALLKAETSVSGRRLCSELRKRFGAVGRTEIVFRIWREETAATRTPVVALDIDELQRRLVAAESAASENLLRAERAELREEAHQDKWALEIDRMRQELQKRKSYASEVRVLSERVLSLSKELFQARRGSD